MDCEAFYTNQSLLKLASMKTRPQKITFGDMHAFGVYELLVYYCRDHRCSHSVEISAKREGSADQLAQPVSLTAPGVSIIVEFVADQLANLE